MHHRSRQYSKKSTSSWFRIFPSTKIYKVIKFCTLWVILIKKVSMLRFDCLQYAPNYLIEYPSIGFNTTNSFKMWSILSSLITFLSKITCLAILKLPLSAKLLHFSIHSPFSRSRYSKQFRKVIGITSLVGWVWLKIPYLVEISYFKFKMHGSMGNDCNYKLKLW